jgi:hypothetical protein
MDEAKPRIAPPAIRLTLAGQPIALSASKYIGIGPDGSKWE